MRAIEADRIMPSSCRKDHRHRQGRYSAWFRLVPDFTTLTISDGELLAQMSQNRARGGREWWPANPAVAIWSRVEGCRTISKSGFSLAADQSNFDTRILTATEKEASLVNFG
jgi:hypothetical protein